MGLKAVASSGGGGGGSGDVTGPGSSTDNAIARYDGTTGKILQNSNCFINDSGDMEINGEANVTGSVNSQSNVNAQGNVTAQNQVIGNSAWIQAGFLLAQYQSSVISPFQIGNYYDLETQDYPSDFLEDSQEGGSTGYSASDVVTYRLNQYHNNLQDGSRVYSDSIDLPVTIVSSGNQVNLVWTEAFYGGDGNGGIIISRDINSGGFNESIDLGSTTVFSDVDDTWGGFLDPTPTSFGPIYAALSSDSSRYAYINSVLPNGGRLNLGTDPTSATEPFVDYQGYVGDGSDEVDYTVVTNNSLGTPTLTHYIKNMINGSVTWIPVFDITFCFLGDTMILTPDGLKRIDSLKEGDEVMSMDVRHKKLTTNKIKNFKKHTISDEYMIINNKLKVTKNHRMFVNGKWDHAANIKIGDRLLNPEGKSSWVYWVSRKYEDNIPVYSLHLENENHNYFADGYLAHNNKCPFLYAVLAEATDDTPMQLDFENTVITMMDRIEKKGVHSLALKNLTNKFVLKEIEPEISYIDEMKLIVRTEDGQSVELLPLDWSMLTTHQGDEAVIEFPPLPENAVAAFMLTTGYYEWLGEAFERKQEIKDQKAQARADLSAKMAPIAAENKRLRALKKAQEENQ